MESTAYRENIVKGLLDAFTASKDKMKQVENPKRALVRFSLDLAKNFLETISEVTTTDLGSD